MLGFDIYFPFFIKTERRTPELPMIIRKFWLCFSFLFLEAIKRKLASLLAKMYTNTFFTSRYSYIIYNLCSKCFKFFVVCRFSVVENNRWRYNFDNWSIGWLKNSFKITHWIDSRTVCVFFQWFCWGLLWKGVKNISVLPLGAKCSARLVHWYFNTSLSVQPHVDWRQFALQK